MIHLGIDFGTSNTVVAYELDGKFNILMFGERAYIPSLAVKFGEEFYFGLEAEKLLPEKKALVIHSIKQDLYDYYEGKKIEVDAERFLLRDILAGFFRHLKGEIEKFLPVEDAEWDIITTVPANASSQQRYITLEAMRSAGLNVRGLLNEPTASGFDFSHYFLKKSRKAKEDFNILVYDFGGGTFDVSLLRIEKNSYYVRGTLGQNNLGGNNFDKKLFSLACAKAGINRRTLTYKQRVEGLMESRVLKESLSLSRGFLRKNIVFDFENIGIDDKLVKLESSEYFEAVKSEINRTAELADELMRSEAVKSRTGGIDCVDYIYLVGGSSKLPYVNHLISKLFPDTKIKIPDNSFATSALGACIYSFGKNIKLFERFTRHFGIIRLVNDREVFDPIFPKGTELIDKTRGINMVVKDYDPRFNIGHLKFIECSEIGNDKAPAGTVNLIQDIKFPYDAEVKDPENERIIMKNLGAVTIREEYGCDACGIISAKITRFPDGFTMGYNIAGS
ncbi:MAG: Hsp70 family protein [Elusimicrobia bacterium]|nr:Hsp70 family protein [Elusimicrobiota bacterium]